MKNRSKILGLILTTALLAVILAVGVFAVEESYTQLATGTCAPSGAVTWTVYEHDVTGEYLLEFDGEGSLQVLDENGEFLAPDYSNGTGWVLNVPWKDYASWITKVIVGDGIVAIDSYTLAIHRNIQTVELGKDVTSLGYNVFQGCNALQTIYRKGNLPETSTLDLTGITYFGQSLFDSCYNFSKIIFTTEGSFTIRENFLKNNTNITSIYLPSACYEVQANAFPGCTNLTTVCVESDETIINANAFATTVNKITDPYKVTVIADGNTATLNTFQMGSILQVDDTTYVVYADESCTTLFPNTVITQNTTVYAKVLFEFVGCEVRVEDYNGLRFIYDYNSNAFSGLDGYTIDIVGVLGARNYGITPVLDHYYHANLLNDTQLIVDGEFTPTAKFISYDSGSYRFAHTAIGYEENSSVVRSKGAAVILSKAYVSLTDSNGNQGFIYSAQGKKDLFDACKATKDTGKLADTTFIDNTLTLYSDDIADAKKLAYDYLNYIYSVNKENILSGQHLYSDTPTTVKDDMQRIYENTGKYPAVLSYDVAKGYRSYKDKSAAEQAEIIATLVEQFKDFSKQGGLITFCAHTTNPSGNYGANVYNGTLTSTEWADLWKNENETSKTFLAELNAYAEVMQAMEDAGIPIFWRPYHEMNMSNETDKFWWSNLNTTTFTTLWTETYKHLETTKGLENLIWIYSPKMAYENIDAEPHVDVYYPGDDYVDVKAIDWYHDNMNPVFDSTLKNPYNSLKNVGEEKPMVYGEFGPNDDLRNDYSGEDAINYLTKLKNTYGWQMGWVVFWSAFEDAPISLDKMDKADVLMSNELIYDLEESRIAFYDTFYNYLLDLFQ